VEFVSCQRPDVLHLQHGSAERAIANRGVGGLAAARTRPMDWPERAAGHVEEPACQWVGSGKSATGRAHWGEERSGVRRLKVGRERTGPGAARFRAPGARGGGWTLLDRDVRKGCSGERQAGAEQGLGG
jgi:hypothetical protein